MPGRKISQYVNVGAKREIPRSAGHVALYFLRLICLPAESFSKSVCVCVCVCVCVFLCEHNVGDFSTLSVLVYL